MGDAATGHVLQIGRRDPAAALAALGRRGLNYDPAQVRPPGWNFDTHRVLVAPEPPGPPVPGGPWEAACAVVRGYEFVPPDLLCAVYDSHTPLLGRDLLLEGRFAALRFLMGVRITSLVDESDDVQRVWGWGYQTLEGHLERGEVVYRVVKHLDSGRVEFTATSHSQPDPKLGPVLRTGWALFGRRSQLRFYHDIGQRLPALVRARLAGGRSGGVASPSGLTEVPPDARPHLLDRVAVYSYDPARRRIADRTVEGQ